MSDHTTFSKTDYAATLASYWLLGLVAGFRKRGFPKAIVRPELFKHVNTAHEIAGTGGTYRGPLPIYDLISYVEQLSQTFSPPLKFNL